MFSDSVYVVWDSGKKANYRIGYDDAFDLRVSLVGIWITT